MLQDMGINLIGHRSKIWQEIQNLSTNTTANGERDIKHIGNDEVIVEGGQNQNTLI